MDEKMLWMAKRLSDVAKDIDKLNEDEKRTVIKRVEKNSPLELIELFNAINEYGEL